MNYSIKNGNCQAVIDELNIRKRTHGKLIDDLCVSFRNVKKATPEKEQRIRDCGSTIMLNETGQIVGANFCKNRYCPICQWRKSRRAFALSFNIQNKVEQTEKLQFLFLTLTLKNSSDLAKGIDEILQSFKRLQDTKLFRRLVKGFFRTLEITYNETAQEWHPHIHAIVAVPDDYFTNEDLYTDYEEWRALWKTVAHTDYYPQCSIKKIADEERASAVAEISKYMVKPLDIELSADTENLYTKLLQCTFGRRLTSTGGIYKKTARNVKKEYEKQCEIEAQKNYDEASVLYTYKFTGYNYIKTQTITKGV